MNPYCFTAFSEIGKFEDDNIHRLLPADSNQPRVIVSDDPKLPIFKPVQNTDNISSKTNCKEYLDCIKRFGGRCLDRTRPYDNLWIDDIDKNCKISTNQDYIPLNERTRTFMSLKVPLDDDVLDEILIIFSKEELIGYFGKSEYDRILQLKEKGKIPLEKTRLENLQKGFRNKEKDDYQKTKCYQDSKSPSKAERIKNCYQNNDPFDE